MMDRRWLIAIQIAGVTLASCTRFPSVVEVRDLGPIAARTTAPDRSAEAVLTYKGYGGAAGTEAYLLYMHKARSQRAFLVLTGRYLKNVRFSWPSNTKLDISMTCGDVQSFENFFYFFTGKGQEQKKITINLESQGDCPPFS